MDFFNVIHLGEPPLKASIKKNTQKIIMERCFNVPLYIFGLKNAFIHDELEMITSQLIEGTSPSVPKFDFAK